MALVTKRGAGELTQDQARKLEFFNNYADRIVASNVKAKASDRMMVKNGLNLPAILISKDTTKTGNMRSVYAKLGSFEKIPECEPGTGPNPRDWYRKLPNGAVHMTHKTSWKKYGNDGKLTDERDPILDYIELRPGSFFFGYTNSHLTDVPEFSLVWLMNVKVELKYSPPTPGNDLPPRDFYTADTVILHTMPGTESVPRQVLSPYESRAQFYYMCLSRPDIEPIITADMRNQDPVLMLFVRDKQSLDEFYLTNGDAGSAHPQLFISTFFASLQPSEDANRNAQAKEEKRMVSSVYNQTTKKQESRKCLRFLMEGDNWNPTESFVDAKSNKRAKHLRFNMNAWSPKVDVFAINCVDLWETLSETILNASNMLLVAHIDQSNTDRLTDNVNGSAAANNIIHWVVRVEAFAFDFPKTLRRCGLKISASTARKLTEADESDKYTPGTSSFIGKGATGDMVPQKPGSSMILCVNEVIGHQELVFDDTEYEYRFVMPKPTMALTYGDVLEDMDAELGDLYYLSRNSWGGNSVLRTAKGDPVKPDHMLRRIEYAPDLVAKAAVFSISKKLKTGSQSHATANNNLVLLESGMECPLNTGAAKKPSMPMITDLDSAGADDDVNMFGDGAHGDGVHVDDQVSMFADDSLTDAEVAALASTVPTASSNHNKKRAEPIGGRVVQTGTKKGRKS